MDDARLQMYDFALKNPLGSLATVSKAAQPSISTLYILAQNDFTFYFGTRTTTQKFSDLSDNPRVAFTLSSAHTLETLQVRGIAELIADTKILPELLEKLRSTFAKDKVSWMTSFDAAAHGIYHQDVSRWLPPVSQIREGSYAFFKISPEWARFRRYDADWREGKDFTELLVTQGL